MTPSSQKTDTLHSYVTCLEFDDRSCTVLILTTSSEWRRRVRRWLVRITTHASSSHHNSPNKTHLKIQALLSTFLHSLLTNQGSDYITQRTIKFSSAYSRLSRRKEKNSGTEEGVKTNNKVRGRILSDLLWLTLAGGNRDGNLVRERRSGRGEREEGVWRENGERQMHNS